MNNLHNPTYQLYLMNLCMELGVAATMLRRSGRPVRNGTIKLGFGGTT